MGQVDLASYKNIYLQTAKEYLGNIQSGYLKLSVNSQDKEALSMVHISSHSLGGQSQIMGFENITVLSGAIEKKSGDILAKVDQADNKFIFLLKDSIHKLNLELLKIKRGDAETRFAARRVNSA
jgi:chemotaxis protein histidine kinase CheA